MVRWGVTRKMQFLETVTVTTLCSHRIIPPFAVEGGAPGMVGVNWAEMPGSARHDLKGCDEIGLRIGAIFGMETPGGGGWGKS